MTIGSRLKECRCRLGYSAEQVAEKLSLSPATVYRYENGDISKLPAKLIEPLASLLSVTPAYLLGWSDDSDPGSSVILNDEEKELVSNYRDAEDPIRRAAFTMLKNSADENRQGKEKSSADRMA